MSTLGFAKGSRMLIRRIGCCRQAPIRSQNARLRMKNAVALRRCFRYLRMKYMTTPLPMAARMMHNA